MAWIFSTRAADRSAADPGQEFDPEAPPPAVRTIAPVKRSRRTILPRNLHPDRKLSKTELRILGILALVPMLTMLARVLAMPGVVDAGWHWGPLDLIRNFGNTLNQSFSLTAVPADQRDHVVFLLFIPTCAMLIELARLTFGIRVLGFRSILISVGFHQAGILSSLLLIGIVVATVVLVRPWLKRTGLPYFARVSVILCIVATTMVLALLAGPWMRSSLLWGAAFFPVIVLGMLAEGIAGTLDRDNMLAASWRAATTILLAFLIALLGRVPALRQMLLQCPEIVVTQIVAIVMIGVFLDLRLLQDWDARVAGMALPKLLSKGKKFRIAVVCNHTRAGTIGRLGRQTPDKHLRRSVQATVDALRGGGHTVRVVEGDMSLLGALRQFMPSDPETGRPGGIVLNLAHGIQGDGRYVHVPAMLEMSGVAYAGAAPLGQALALDRMAIKTLLHQAGIATPAFHLMAKPDDELHGLQYPLAVWPRHEPGRRAVVVHNRAQLTRAVKKVIQRYGQEAVVEEHLAGRRIQVSLLGNSPIECLPLVEMMLADRAKVCPAPIDKVMERKVRASAKAVFRLCGCRDYARIDMVLGPPSTPYVESINTMAILERRGSFALAGAQAGYTYSKLMCRVVEVARARYLAGKASAPRKPTVTGSPVRNTRPGAS